MLSINDLREYESNIFCVLLNIGSAMNLSSKHLISILDLCSRVEYPYPSSIFYKDPEKSSILIFNNCCLY
jgi:hypothetical protein